MFATDALQVSVGQSVKVSGRAGAPLLPLAIVGWRESLFEGQVYGIEDDKAVITCLEHEFGAVRREREVLQAAAGQLVIGQLTRADGVMGGGVVGDDASGAEGEEAISRLILDDLEGAAGLAMHLARHGDFTRGAGGADGDGGGVRGALVKAFGADGQRGQNPGGMNGGPGFVRLDREHGLVEVFCRTAQVDRGLAGTVVTATEGRVDRRDGDLGRRDRK